MKNKTKKIVYITLFSLLIVSFIILLIFTRDSKKIININEFIKTDTKVLYITENIKLNYPNKILDKYEIDYLKIDSSELNIFDRKKLKKIINYKKLKNIIVIYKNGKIVDKLINSRDEQEIDKFFQKNEIIPIKIVNNVSSIMTDALSILEDNYSIVYIPYKKNKDLDIQDKIFKEISNKYSIKYKKIDAYLLSYKQQEKINNLLGLSFVDDQILVLIKDNKMVSNIRGIHSKKTYIAQLYEANFINELENKINELDYDSFKEKLNTKEKNIILIGSDELKDSNDVYELLNKMIYNYEINVSYINIKKDDTELYDKIKEDLETIGYTEGFSLPLAVIVESNNILDYAVGNSKEEYFIDIFKENGVIKGDVINE